MKFLFQIPRKKGEKMELLHKDCKSKLDILKEHFAECFDKDGKFNLEKFQSEIAANWGGGILQMRVIV